jgi:3-deoxy-D-manno-octulosonic acid kinase
MSKDGCRRIATADGAMLADPASIGNLAGNLTGDLAGALEETELSSLFDPLFWQRRGALVPVSRGRGSAWFVSTGADAWVLRHFRRGGLIARLSADRYIWAGESRVRAFAEWRLLQVLSGLGLPVPQPIAARYQRGWLTYRCDLITRLIPDTKPLSAALIAAPLARAAWRAVGAAIARLHAQGVDHADLNAHNILLDAHGAISVIDFDRGRIRRHGAWMERNLLRLRRSLDKIALSLPPGRFPTEAWEQVLVGYQSN